MNQSEEQALLARNIREALSQPGAPTPGQIAERCCVSEQAVNNWKRTGKIDIRNLIHLSDLTGWGIRRLLGLSKGPDQEGKPSRTVQREVHVEALVDFLGMQFQAVRPPTRKAIIALLEGLIDDPLDTASTAQQIGAILACAGRPTDNPS